MDARDDVDRPQGHDQAPGSGGAPTGAAPAAGWYRRPWGIAVIAAAGVLAVGGIAVGAAALAGDDDDDPPVAASASPTPTQSAEPSATETPSPTPTPTETATTPPAVEPEPEAPVVPGIEACGTTAPAATNGGGLWVGDYGGGMAADVTAPVELRWSIISEQDWSAQAVTATVLGLWITSDDGTVLAVPAPGVPPSLSIAMTSGSEGGGSGSEGAIAVTTQFRACPDGTAALPDGQYRGRIGVTVTAGSTTQTVWGDVPVLHTPAGS